MALDCDKREILVGDLVVRLIAWSTPSLPNKEGYKVTRIYRNSIRLDSDMDVSTSCPWDSYKFRILPRVIDNWEEAMK